jgi:hypothetical protein
MPALDDPFALDRRLREVARARLGWRRALREGAGEEHRFTAVGAFASADLVRELREASRSDPLAPELSRWAYHLHLEHATRDLVAQRERALYAERCPITAPESGKFTLDEMRSAALADTKGARSGWFAALFAHAATAAEFELRRWERRVELANALGDASPDAVELPKGRVVELAREFLHETRDAMAELGAQSIANLVEVALARGAAASWPSRLTLRSLAELFDEAKWLEGVALDAVELPRVLGASSFLRGLVGFGAALRTALASPSLPFAVAHDPSDLPGKTLGALLALVPFGESFALRKLGVSRARLRDHERDLRRALLVGSRGLALRVLLRAPTLAGAETLRRAYPERAFEAIGVELPTSAAAVLFRSRVSDPARFAGLLLATHRARELRDVHDEDWYRNPRAVDEVRETSRQRALNDAREASLERGRAELAQLLTNTA